VFSDVYFIIYTAKKEHFIYLIQYSKLKHPNPGKLVNTFPKTKLFISFNFNKTIIEFSKIL